MKHCGYAKNCSGGYLAKSPETGQQETRRLVLPI